MDQFKRRLSLISRIQVDTDLPSAFNLRFTERPKFPGIRVVWTELLGDRLQHFLASLCKVSGKRQVILCGAAEHFRLTVIILFHRKKKHK